MADFKRVLLSRKTPAGLHLTRALGWMMFLCCPHLAGPGGFSLTQARSLCLAPRFGAVLHVWTLLQSRAVPVLQGAQGCGWGQLGATTIAGCGSLAELVMYLKKKKLKKILPFVC